jgi:hypothetical protein
MLISPALWIRLLFISWPDEVSVTPAPLMEPAVFTILPARDVKLMALLEIMPFSNEPFANA